MGVVLEDESGKLGAFVDLELLKLRVAVVVGDIVDDSGVESLMNVLQSQKAEDFCVVSLDRSYGEKMQNGSAAQKFPVSRTQAVTHGAY